MLDKVSCRKRRRRRRVAKGFSRGDWDRLDKDPRLSAARNAMEFVRVDRAAEALLPPCSPDRGRPAWDPDVLICSFLLMLRLGYTSIQRWHDALAADVVLRWLVGSEDVPSVGAHYDFINRVTRDDPHRDELYPARKNSREVKAELRAQSREAPKRNEKLVSYDEGDTKDLKRRYWDDAACDAGRRPLALERALDLVAVRPSMERYASHLGGGLVLSGDGSSLHIHSSPHGHRVDDPPDDAHTHRHAAPDADIGWDSDRGVFFLGYTFHDISWHVGDLGIDLPVFVAQRAASRHDALTCVTATAHMLDADPSLRPDRFCHDSAADSAHIFGWMRHRGILPAIGWNPRHSPRDPDGRRPVAKSIKDADGRPLEFMNPQGVPVCACGHEMARDGCDRSKMATKYRCPFAVGRIGECPRWGVCTKSKYGRVIKTYDRTDLELFGPLVCKSDEWKATYKDRTCTERVNNRVLNDYNVRHLTCRNGSKHFFFEVMAAINIHMDAWVKTSG